jgi:hypothetical protein
MELPSFPPILLRGVVLKYRDNLLAFMAGFLVSEETQVATRKLSKMSHRIFVFVCYIVDTGRKGCAWLV